MRDISKNYDLITGRDGQGQKWITQVPAGVAEPGMFVLLKGGRFIVIHSVEHMAPVPEETKWGCAMQVLAPAWGGRT